MPSYLLQLNNHIDQVREAILQKGHELARQDGAADPSVNKQDYNISHVLYYTQVHDKLYLPLTSYLHKSILAGEYYLKPFIRLLTEIQEKVSALSPLLKEAKAAYGPFFVEELAEEALSQISIYLRFGEDRQHQLDHHDDVIFHSDNPSSKEISEENLQEMIRTLVNWEKRLEKSEISFDYKVPYYRLLFRISLRLALIDANLHCSRESLPGLLTLNHFFSDNEKRRLLPLAKIIADKGLYLQSKIIRRFGADTAENADRQFYPNYCVPIFLGTREVKTIEYGIQFYTYFHELTQELYSDRICDFSLEKERIFQQEENVLRSLRNKKPLDFLAIVRLSRAYYLYAGELARPSERAETLFLEVRKQKIEPNDTLGIFDVYAHNSLISLLYCNWLKTIHSVFKRKIEDNVDRQDVLHSKKQLDHVFSIAVEVAKTTKVKSYNPYRIYIDSYLHYLRYERRIASPAFTIEDINREINRFLMQFMTYSQNLEWAKDHHHLTLYLPYQDCLIPGTTDLDEQHFQLFLDSSFVLPVNIDYLRKEHDYLYDALQTERILLTHQLIAQSRLAAEASIQAKINESQVRNIEVLSLFTAILAFVLVGVGSLPRFTDFFILALFLVGLATCLGIFVMFVDYVLHKQFRKLSWIPVLLAIGLFAGAIYVKVKWPTQLAMPFHQDTGAADSTAFRRSH